jgi:DNA-binding transcriptional regulator YdaS (Cro superfamily)
MRNIMQTFSDFCEWMKPQRRVADALGISEASVSRMRSGAQPITPDVAEKCEAISHGLFRKEKILWPDSQAAA